MALDLASRWRLIREDVLAQFGEPSLVADGRVLCYVNESADWVLFDCWEDVSTVYDEEVGHFRRGQVENPLLRNARVPAPNFNESLVLTKYGKNLRWGPGWRLHHQRDDDYPDGVREQLISIDDDDPSQSLGLRRP